MSERQRIEDLEILVAHQSRIIEDLSDELRRQGDTMDRLQTAVRALGQRFQALEDVAAPRQADAPPPHY